MTGARADRRRGLTLVEVVVALGLAAALLGTVFVFVQDLVSARERIERVTARERSIDLFLDALEQAAASCTLEADGGVVGDALHCRIASASSDPLRLMASGASPFPAAVSTSFGFEESDGSLRLRRGDGAEESLPAELFAIRFRYHDGFEWVDEFDGLERRRLPAAIEVSLWSAAWPEGVRPPWLPELGTVEEIPPTAEHGDARALEAFLQGPTITVDDDEAAAPRSDEARDGMHSGGERELASAPVPDRRRVIIVPDPAPAALAPVAPTSSHAGSSR